MELKFHPKESILTVQQTKKGETFNQPYTIYIVKYIFHIFRGEIFTSGTLYQTSLSDAEFEIGKSINKLSSQTQWTTEQRDLHEKVRLDALRKESLGQVALILAEMKGQKHNGILIQRDNKFLEYINTTEEGDLAYLKAVFEFLTGRGLKIGVKHSNDMSFADSFFM